MSLIDLYKNDEILADELCDAFSLRPEMQHTDDNPTGFRLMSDYMTHKYPQLVMDAEGVLHPKADAPVVNFYQLKELLLSKDLSRLRELDWISQEQNRFLDNTVDMTGNRVGLDSFPRSGNSFLRKFLE